MAMLGATQGVAAMKSTQVGAAVVVGGGVVVPTQQKFEVHVLPAQIRRLGALSVLVVRGASHWKDAQVFRAGGAGVVVRQEQQCATVHLSLGHIIKPPVRALFTV